MYCSLACWRNPDLWEIDLLYWKQRRHCPGSGQTLHSHQSFGCRSGSASREGGYCILTLVAGALIVVSHETIFLSYNNSNNEKNFFIERHFSSELCTFFSWLRDLLTPVPTQLHGEHTALLPWRRYRNYSSIQAVTLQPGTHSLLGRESALYTFLLKKKKEEARYGI